ncbi:MAG: amino acid dehydrogenase [Cyclobacteriaceae bacterium]|nr:MAG: amino acid dehydrogenase [Cyclobacteriaceae bacterium]
MKVILVGGGIVGISTAYYLLRSGHEVVVVDGSDLLDGCSFGNAGMVVPSHIVPLASPGMIARGIRWMFRSDSPFFIKPRLSADLLRWGWQFYRHSNHRHVQRAAPALKALSLLSKNLYCALAAELPFAFGYTERGLLMLYRSAEAEQEEAEAARFANALGLEARVLSAGQVQQLEPHVAVSVRGGVYYPGDAHLVPHKLMQQWIPYLAERGVRFISGEEVQDFKVKAGRIVCVCTEKQELTADEVVLSAGAWSGNVARRLGINIPMQAGKGYSFLTGHNTLPVTIPAILLEDRVAVTPMGDEVRLGGTMEITGLDLQINMKRVHAIARAIPRYYPKAQINFPPPETVWSGLRPCPPDGLPYIGRTRRYKNLVLATGHAMMGLSLAPATGKLVSQIINGEETAVPVDPFSPDRF